MLQALSVSVDDLLPMKNGQCLGSSQLLSQQRSESKHWSSKGSSMYSVVDLRSAISTKQASISMVCKSSRMNAFRNSNFSALLERFWYFSNELCQVPDRAQISPVPCRSPPSLSSLVAPSGPGGLLLKTDACLAKSSQIQTCRA